MNPKLEMIILVVNQKGGTAAVLRVEVYRWEGLGYRWGLGTGGAWVQVAGWVGVVPAFNVNIQLSCPRIDSKKLGITL